MNLDDQIAWNKENSRNEKVTAEINISKQPSITEVWYEGYVLINGKKHQFWLIEPQNCDFELECRWFFKEPREIRALSPQIIEAFKEQHGYE